MSDDDFMTDREALAWIIGGLVVWALALALVAWVIVKVLLVLVGI